MTYYPEFNIDQTITLELTTPGTGEGFRIQRDESGAVHISIYDDRGDLGLQRTLVPASNYELDDLLDFTRGIAEVITCDEEAGMTYANFAARDFRAWDMDLHVHFALSDAQSNAEVRVVFIFFDDRGPYSASATLALEDLVAAVSHIDGGCRV